MQFGFVSWSNVSTLGGLKDIIHIHMYIWTLYVCIYVCIYIRMYIYVCVYMYTVANFADVRLRTGGWRRRRGSSV